MPPTFSFTIFVYNNLMDDGSHMVHARVVMMIDL